MKIKCGKAKVKPANPGQYTFIMYVLSRRHQSQTMAARCCGCSVPFLNQVILGRKKSRAVEERLARFLGYRSWAYMQLKIKSFEEWMLETGENGGEIC